MMILDLGHDVTTKLLALLVELSLKLRQLHFDWAKRSRLLQADGPRTCCPLCGWRF
jgi:hypothetical protein